MSGLTRQEIKHDEVREGLERVAEFIGDNARTLGYVLLAIVVGLSGLALWNRMSAGREQRANEQLAMALEGAAEAGGDLSGAREGLRAVVESYGSVRAGSVAHAYLGTLAARENDFDAARQHWGAFLADHHDHALAAGVERNLISLDRAEGKDAELAEHLRAVLAGGTASALGADLIMLELAQTLEDLDQIEGARDSYSRLLEEHPTSIFAAQARERSEALASS